MRLTVPRLLAVFSGVLAVLVAGALLADRLNLGRPPAHVARAIYATGDAVRGERAVLRGLRKEPRSHELWELLVTSRAGAYQKRKNDGRPSTELSDFDSETRALLDRAPDGSYWYLYWLYTGRPLAALGITAEAGGAGGAAALARGDFALTRSQPAMALAEYRRAVAAGPQSTRAIGSFLDTLGRLKRRDALEEYLRKADLLRHAPTRHRVEGHLLRGEYILAGRYLLQEQMAAYAWANVGVGLLTGSFWLLLLLQLGRVGEWERHEQALVPAALILGALSAHATLWVAVVQDHWIAFELREKTLLFNLLYAVAGIGLREELIKLLFFSPLLLAGGILRGSRPLRWLVLGSAVGLGFAVEENIAYFARDPGAVFSRFVTANFFHMTLSGIAGLHFSKLLSSSPTGREGHLEVLGLVVLLHGAYDFFLIDRTVAAFAWLAYTVYIWTAGQYFGQVHALVGNPQRRWPLSYAFTAALAAGIGGGYVLATIRSGPILGIFAVAAGVLGTAIITVMFFREFNEPMARRR